MEVGGAKRRKEAGEGSSQSPGGRNEQEQRNRPQEDEQQRTEQQRTEPAPTQDRIGQDFWRGNVNQRNERTGRHTTGGRPDNGGNSGEQTRGRLASKRKERDEQGA